MNVQEKDKKERLGISYPPKKGVFRRQNRSNPLK